MERLVRSRFLIFFLVAIPFVLGIFAYLNLKKKGALADVTALVGSELTIQPAGIPDRHRGGIKSPINSGDRLETGPGTTATLEFVDGSVIEVAPESRVQIEKDESLIPPQTTLQILVGQAKAIQTGSGRLILIADQQSHEIGAVELPETGPVHATESIATSPSSPMASSTTSTTTSTTLANASDTGGSGPEANSLPTEYIESVIRGQRSHISRCFSDLLRKSSRAHGRMDVSFTIENSGKPTRVHILGSTLADSTFNSCISGVFERLQFRTFQGESIIINYPLQFQ